PPDLSCLSDRLCGELRGALIKEDVGARGFERNNLRVDSGLRRIVGEFRHDHALCGLGTKAVFEAFDVVATRVVVLVENADLAMCQVLQNVICIDPPLCLIRRLPAHGPWKAFPIAKLGGAGSDEELWHLLLIHILPNGIVGRCAQALKMSST